MFPASSSLNSMPGEAFFNSSYPLLIAICVGIFCGLRHYFKGTKYPRTENLSGKIVIITGANSGIGLELTRSLAVAGAKVIMACRDKSRADRAIASIRGDSPNAQVNFMKLDLASFTSVRKFVMEFKTSESKLDILINNGGIMCKSECEAATMDGNEIHFQVNYLSHFLLTYLLSDVLKATHGSRIINNTAHAYKLAEFSLAGLTDLSSTDVNANLSQARCDGNDLERKDKSSAAFATADVDPDAAVPNGRVSNDEDDESSQTNADRPKVEPVTSAVAYAQSKLAMILFTRKLASKFDSPPAAFVANPGVVRTDLYNSMPFRKNPVLAFILSPFLWFFMKTPSDGAQTALYCATAPNLKSGECYSECAVSRLETNALGDKEMDLLWESSLKICSL